MTARCPSSRSMRAQRSPLIRLPSRDPGRTRRGGALPLWRRTCVLAYLARTLRDSLEVLGPAPDEDDYFHKLALFHEDMHGEAFVYTRQTLRYPAPPLPGSPGDGRQAGP